MLNFCGIVVAILKMETGRKFSMSGINTGRWNRTMLNLWWPFWKWRLVEIFRSQESIRDIIIYPHIKWRWNRTMLNLCGSVVAIFKMATSRNFSMSGINSGHHYLPTYQIWWYRTMLNFCSIVVAILKMVTGRNFSMSGINSGHHYLLTYQMLMILDNDELLRYYGGHFENGNR